MSVPTLLFFRGGNELGRADGLIDDNALERALASTVGEDRPALANDGIADG